MSELSELLADLRPYAARRVGSLRINTDDLRVLLAAIDAARAEGVAPVFAPLDCEGVARIVDPLTWGKIDKVMSGGLDGLIPEGWSREQYATSCYYEERQDSLTKADAILALSQQDQVGLTTPAVLGEPSADALRSGGEDAVGAAERDVGRYIYRRIETLMDAKHVTGIANELTYLATIAEAVEEYGSEACGGEDLSVFQGPPPPAGGVK